MASRVPGGVQRQGLNPRRTLIAVTQLVGRGSLLACRVDRAREHKGEKGGED